MPGPRRADTSASLAGPARPFKGNKASLPSKPCVACGRAMTWRKRWTRDWDEVKYCSEACRKPRAPAQP